MVGAFTTDMYFKCDAESTYDPDTSKVIERTETSAVFKGIIGKAKDNMLTSAGIAAVTERLEVTVKCKDIPEDYSKFDTIHFKGVDHRVINYIDDGYTIQFVVSTR
jgi:hypothetical protein